MVIIMGPSGLAELSLVRIHKILLVAILLLSSIASAEISLGTVQADKSASVYPGETAQFKILLFTTQSPVHVSFAYELPDKTGILINVPVEEIGEERVISEKSIDDLIVDRITNLDRPYAQFSKEVSKDLATVKAIYEDLQGLLEKTTTEQLHKDEQQLLKIYEIQF